MSELWMNEIEVGPRSSIPYARNPLGEAKAELDRKYFPKKRSSLQV